MVVVGCEKYANNDFCDSSVENFALSFLLQSSTILYLHFKNFKTLRFFITILGILHCCRGRKKWHFKQQKEASKHFSSKFSLCWCGCEFLLSDWGVYVSFWLEISRIFGIFVLFCFFFFQCWTWFSGFKVVLFVVLVNQNSFFLNHNGFKIVFFVVLVKFYAPSISIYFFGS